MIPRSSSRRLATLGLLAVVLLGACAREESPDTATAEGEPVVDFSAGEYGGLTPGADAAEFEGLGPWLNSPSLTLAGLQVRNQVVLVDFWTYTCVNCLRTLPFLRDWDEKYGDRGLTIVGVHSPEFEFEKDPENVARAVRDEGIAYPVAQDNEWGTWTAFENNVWPAKYLVGADGRILYRHFGEGGYDETEEAIRFALIDAGYEVDDIPIGGIDAPVLDPDAVGITRELYFGYGRNYHPQGVYAAQEMYYDGPDETRLYTDPGPPRSHNVWYAQGEWTNGPEALVHARASTGLEDYIAFRFAARTVNPVLHPGADGEPYDVVVQLDGFALRPEQAGEDITYDALGRSILHVDEARMYRAVHLPELGDAVLRLSSDAPGFTIFAVTFGAYTEGP
jgi:thiol-disulfide isomerase/thioredoxin